MILSFGIPIPLSSTKNLTFTLLSFFSINETFKSTLPLFGVNLIALFTKFDNTCLNLIPSVKTQVGIASSKTKSKSILLSSAFLENKSYTF